MAEEIRERSGTVADRVPPPAKVATTAALGYGTWIALATAHYLFKCYMPGVGFHFFPPDDALLEGWVVALLPTVHQVLKIFHHHLDRLAGEAA